MKLLACNSNWNVPNQCLDFITTMLSDATPIKEGLPKSYYDAKRLVSMMGLKAKRIDCCVKGFMLFMTMNMGKIMDNYYNLNFVIMHDITTQKLEQVKENQFL